MTAENRWLPGLWVVGETEDGDESYLSGPWFSEEDAEADRMTWAGAPETVYVVGWLR